MQNFSSNHILKIRKIKVVLQDYIFVGVLYRTQKWCQVHKLLICEMVGFFQRLLVTEQTSAVCRVHCQNIQLYMHLLTCRPISQNSVNCFLKSLYSHFELHEFVTQIFLIPKNMELWNDYFHYFLFTVIEYLINAFNFFSFFLFFSLYTFYLFYFVC